MRALAAQVPCRATDLLDTAGTGGGRRTFNVSTTAALIAAGAGCTVAKHGNRSATGLSGSADVLEALGARIDLAPAEVGRCIDEVGFGFMFAPAHHQATRYVIPVRRAARGPDDLQLPRSADEPGRRDAAADRRVRRRATSRRWPARWRCSGPSTRCSSPARTASTSSASRRRRWWSRWSAASSGGYTVSPEEVGLSRAPAERIPGGDAGGERGDRAGDLRRRVRRHRAGSRRVECRRRDLRRRARRRRSRRECGAARACGRRRRGGRGARAVRAANPRARAVNRLDPIVACRARGGRAPA